MFVWLFHRISGVSLIVLFGIKILTSFFLFTKDKKPDWALSLHRQPVIDVSDSHSFHLSQHIRHTNYHY